MPTIQDAQRLLAWMRSEGLLYARVGEVALSLGEPVSTESSVDLPSFVRPRAGAPELDPDLYGGEIPSFVEETT